MRIFAVAFALALAQEPAKDPDLLVHLTFDDGAAPGVAQGKVAWEAGKLGKAAVFDGSGGHVEIPGAAALDTVNEGSYTIAAWFKPADVPPGKENENNANYGILNKNGWHEGIRYGNDKKFVFEHWIAGPKPEEPEWKGAGTWENEYEPGQWYHVAGVVDRPAGVTKLYVNGELINTGDFPANAPARAYGKTTWKVGTAAPGSAEWAWPAKGAIDDVRVYKKALSDADVAALFKAK
jgi:arabinan endo-1,5-alpha-L-arabinosidase